MNEIIIEDKKYISSKRAAEMTGYAKDYVGQLCREGRVPARLIGRNWYVLESAIGDHRFRLDQSTEPETSKSNAEKEEKDLLPAATWQAARYEAVSPADLPPINRLAEEPLTQTPATPQDIGVMQDTWQEWFAAQPSKTAPIEESVIEEDIGAEEPTPALVPEIEPTEDSIIEDTVEDEPVTITMRPIKHTPIPAATPPLPVLAAPRHRYMALPSVFAASIAVAALGLLALNSGYLDSYLTSYQQASVITGLQVYSN